MPRRMMGVRWPCLTSEKLILALEGDQEKPSIEEIIEFQDQKLQEVKRNVFSGLSMPLKLIAQPALLSEDIPSPALVISTHYNDQKQSIFSERNINEAAFIEPPLGLVPEADFDFSKAENLFLLEAPIDAKKDHNMLRLAYEIPKRTFMGRLLRRYPVNRKRLAFIQRQPCPTKSIEVVGNLIVSAKGGEAKEVAITCQVCGQKFGHQHQFQRHILMHPDPEAKKFLCQICGKRFNRADHLNRHAVLHMEVKLHKCLLCGEEFDRASHLDRHRRKHHPPAGQQPSQTPPLTPQMTSPVPVMDFPNSFNRVLDNNNQMTSQGTVDQQSSGHNLHLLASVATPEGQLPTSHYAQPLPPRLSQDNGYDNKDEDEHVLHMHLSGHEEGMMLLGPGEDGLGRREIMPEPERPYPCEICGRKFIRATHLRRHMRIHTGEKPFACHICGRRYARGDYLRAHIHAHRRDKIHKCKHCGEVFHDLTRFADHCRLVHKDLNDQFGNPKAPPESSPPPPSLSVFLDSSLVMETPEEITVIQSLNTMDNSVPITLVTLPDPSEQEAVITSIQPPPCSQYHSSLRSNAIVQSHSLPTPNHMSMSSRELQMPPLHAISAHSPSEPSLLPQNGQIHISDMQNHDIFRHNPLCKTMPLHEVYSHTSHIKATPISYVDNMGRYVYSNSSSSSQNNGGEDSSFLTHHSSPLVHHNYHQPHSH